MHRLVLFLSLVCMVQAGLLGGIVVHDESDKKKSRDDTASRPVGLLSGVGGISHEHQEGKEEPQESHSLLLDGIGGISSRNQGAAQLALRDSLEKEDASNDDTENNAAESDSAVRQSCCKSSRLDLFIKHCCPLYIFN
jgi:hypothetical protein